MFECANQFDAILLNRTEIDLDKVSIKNTRTQVIGEN